MGGYEFALSAAICHVPPQGERIATPVCALARNDMLKTGRCARVQGRGLRWQAEGGGVAAGARTSPPIVIARSAATWQSAFPAAGHDRKQYFGRIRESATDLPKVVPACRVSLRGRGLPRQCAHWFAMTSLVGMRAPGQWCNVPRSRRGIAGQGGEMGWILPGRGGKLPG